MLAGNGNGLAMWRHFITVSPQPQPNKNTKDEDNKQKPIRITSAGTAAENDKMLKLQCPATILPNPMLAVRFLSTDEKLTG